AFLNISAAKKQIEISERSLKSAEMNYESAKERFAVGAGSITDYLLANSQVVTAKIDRISAIYTYFESKMQMQFALGELR
ncbi:MAG TPA: TolC family protein, partial [Candidatus Kapabacteria bacterium]|nr:TolC family protein [Candidatus Kapabacteria bacterium]